MGAVDVKMTAEQELTLEWDSSASNDMIADSTLALINGIDKSPASVKRLLFLPLSWSPLARSHDRGSSNDPFTLPFTLVLGWRHHERGPYFGARHALADTRETERSSSEPR